MAKRKSPRVTPQMAQEILELLRIGDLNQHDIAAKFGINQGRVSEINTGRRMPPPPHTQNPANAALPRHVQPPSTPHTPLASGPPPAVGAWSAG